MSGCIGRRGPRPRKAPEWSKYPLRRCLTMHTCELCDKGIKLGENYRDGGYGRRAHQECVYKVLS